MATVRSDRARQEGTGAHGRARAWPKGCSPTSSGRRSTQTIAMAAVGGLCAGPRRCRLEGDRGRARAGLSRRRVRRRHRRGVRRSCGHRAFWCRRARGRRPRARRKAVAELGYRIARIEAPGVLDGGDVLKHGGTVYVGQSGRTNADGIAPVVRAPGAVRRDGGRGSADQGATPQVGGDRAAGRHHHRLPAGGGRPVGLRGVPSGARGAGRPRRPARRRQAADVVGVLQRPPR